MREVTDNPSVGRSEDDGGDAFEDIEVVEKVWVLEEKGVGWVSAKVDGATGRIRERQRQWANNIAYPSQRNGFTS